MRMLTAAEKAKMEELYLGQTVEYLGSSDPDPHTRLKAGDRGKVKAVDSLGTLHVQWDGGGTLGLIFGVDHYKVV